MNTYDVWFSRRDLHGSIVRITLHAESLITAKQKAEYIAAHEGLSLVKVVRIEGV